ncbi:hypothetical protein GCM10027355_00790 [Haloplanus salinarum]
MSGTIYPGFVRIFEKIFYVLSWDGAGVLERPRTRYASLTFTRLGGVTVDPGGTTDGWNRKMSAPTGIRTTVTAKPLPDSNPSYASRSKNSLRCSDRDSNHGHGEAAP